MGFHVHGGHAVTLNTDMLLIGSRAIKHHFPDFRREPKDTDYAVMEKLPGDRPNRTEYLEIPELCSLYEPGSIIEPDDLYTLKMSHVFWSILQEKHLSDLSFLKLRGCKLNPELFKTLYRHWEMKHGPNVRQNFDKANEEFFNDHVKREMDHDDIHAIMNPEPLYKLAKEDLGYAAISQRIFTILPLETQMDIVREEAYVLAIERFLIPGTGVHWRVAYARMLRAMIGRLTPLWLGIFIADNYSILNKPKFNFYKKFNDHGKENFC